jgi:hypothetical protein
MITTVPYSIAVSKLRGPFLFDRYFFIVVRLLKRREKFGRPLETALRPACTNLIAPSRAGKDADHKSGGPRYPSASGDSFFRSLRRGLRRIDEGRQRVLVIDRPVAADPVRSFLPACKFLIIASQNVAQEIRQVFP